MNKQGTTQQTLNEAFQKNARRVFWLFFLFFLLLAVYFAKLIFVDGDAIAMNPYNPRVRTVDPLIRRGSVLDKNGHVLAESVRADESADAAIVRRYPYGTTLAHVVGYTDPGQSGLEGQLHFGLQSARFELWQRFKQIALGEEIRGNNAVLTVDADFSTYISEQLGDRPGAVVIMEPATGKILSMVSYPDFNPATVSDNWDTLTGAEDSPLLNRATQGLYIPGSVFKTVTAAAAIQNLTDWAAFTYDCAGEAYFGVNRLVCFDSKAHGQVDFTKAFAESCNLYYAELGQKLSAAALRATADALFIDKSFDFDLPVALGSFTLPDGATTSETIETAIGQGKTLVTPLNMAMVAAAAANGGLMMRPYLVDSLTSADGTAVIQKYLPQALGQVIETETADTLKELMVACVTEGRGAPAAIPGVQVAGKTGTAENPSGADHSWFIGFAPAESPEIAFAVLLENAGPGGQSLALARAVLAYYFDR